MSDHAEDALKSDCAALNSIGTAAQAGLARGRFLEAREWCAALGVKSRAEAEARMQAVPPPVTLTAPMARDAMAAAGVLCSVRDGEKVLAYLIEKHGSVVLPVAPALAHSTVDAIVAAYLDTRPNCETAADAVRVAADRVLKATPHQAPVERPATTPVPMLLTCPACGVRHVDVGEFATRPHHTHACQKCGMCWRPALIATCGVQFLPGFKNLTPTGGTP